MIASFYQALQQRDHAAMAACYHPSIHFSDPVFGDLHGDEARAMWHMLCERGTDLAVTYEDISVTEDRGRAHWEARYDFGPKRRPVHNRIDAKFAFDQGKIVRHRDDFDVWRWTRMALGVPGTLMGWTGFSKTKVRTTALRGLDRFIAEHPEYTRRSRS
jgi:limonene-1,2-epoxide hydrolase